MDPASVSAEAALVLMLQLCLGLFFLPGAIRKLRHQRSFVEGVVNYQVLPKQIAKVLGTVLPWVELFCAFLLIFGLALRIAAVVILILLLCFTVAVMLNLHRGREIKCNCYGIANTATISWGTVVRNLLLLLIAVIFITLAPNVTTLDQWRTLWQEHFAIFSSFSTTIMFCLLLAFCFVVIYLSEWAVDISSRVARLKALNK